MVSLKSTVLTYVGSLSQRTHIRFADSDDDDENREVALFSSMENTESKDALNDVNNGIFPVDYPQLDFEAKNETVYESVDGENMIKTFEKRKRRRNTTRMLEKMPTEVCMFLSLSRLYIYRTCFNGALFLQTVIFRLQNLVTGVCGPIRKSAASLQFGYILIALTI